MNHTQKADNSLLSVESLQNFNIAKMSNKTTYRYGF
jgi:hypothetical protein